MYIRRRAAASAKVRYRVVIGYGVLREWLDVPILDKIDDEWKQAQTTQVMQIP